MKSSLVKAEPLGDEHESTVQVSASFGPTKRERAPSTGSAERERVPHKAGAEEKEDVLMKISFPDQETYTADCMTQPLDAVKFNRHV